MKPSRIWARLVAVVFLVMSVAACGGGIIDLNDPHSAINANTSTTMPCPSPSPWPSVGDSCIAGSSCHHNVCRGIDCV
jgi:hypothetical protein